MTTSVVVPTYNGRQRILNFLHSMRQQTLIPDQVIVVIDGSKDGTAEAIAAEDFSALPLTVHTQTNAGRPAARNAGLRLSTGHLILSFDDDMVLTPTVVEQHVAHQKAYPDTVCIGYQAEKKPEPNDPNFIFLDFRYTLSQKWRNSSPQVPAPLSVTDYQLTTANCSFPRSVVDKVGFFDEALKEVEDFDLGTRMVKHGYTLYFNPEIVAWHDNPGWTFAKFIERQAQYRKDDLAWLAKVEKEGVLTDELRQHPRCAAGKTYSGLKAFSLSVLSWPVWVSLAEKKWIEVLPKSFRYKIMDYITTAHTYQSTNRR